MLFQRRIILFLLTINGYLKYLGHGLMNNFISNYWTEIGLRGMLAFVGEKLCLHTRNTGDSIKDLVEWIESNYLKAGRAWLKLHRGAIQDNIEGKTRKYSVNRFALK